MGKIRVDVASLAAGFPKDMPPPALLVELGAWLKTISHGTLGYFDAFASEPLDDTYVSNDAATAALREKLGIFLSLPDGSRLAAWNHGGKAGPAIVLIGSEGDLGDVAPTLEAFLHALAAGKTGVADLDDDEASASRAKLAAWLAKKKIATKAAAKAPPFRRWFDATVKAAKQRAPKPKKLAAAPTPADLIARVDALIGKLGDDPAVVALCAELGFDLPSIRDADALRSLASPAGGFALQFAWPWDYPNEGLEERYPKAKRKGVKARMLWGIEVFAAGYKEVRRGSNRPVVFEGFKGTLPNRLSFDDDIRAAKKRFGNLRYTFDDSFIFYDPKRDTTCAVDFADDDDDFADGAMTRVAVRRRSGFEP